jgi:hypothetical protein
MREIERRKEAKAGFGAGIGREMKDLGPLVAVNFFFALVSFLRIDR